jgi:hypothetical protein
MSSAAGQPTRSRCGCPWSGLEWRSGGRSRFSGPAVNGRELPLVVVVLVAIRHEAGPCVSVKDFLPLRARHAPGGVPGQASVVRPPMAHAATRCRSSVLKTWWYGVLRLRFCRRGVLVSAVVRTDVRRSVRSAPGACFAARLPGVAPAERRTRGPGIRGSGPHSGRPSPAAPDPRWRATDPPAVPAGCGVGKLHTWPACHRAVRVAVRRGSDRPLEPRVPA